ncbi:translocon-associated protein subunit beta [Agrilus planipennis]|uniref:Translocon-associated protein subunit beta n=1 Tax=Agrilus planipennis TaxID=224129 RepID=A0A1W4WXR6_AGRPL|nr:translocon-associated protein subunit beta [Agrilus planipennis]
MKQVLFILCSVLVIFVRCNSEEETRARLLVSKHILNTYLVENMDINVKYSLFNIGNSAAVDVTLNDRSFGPEAFAVMGGQLKAHIDRIPSHSNYTHVVVVRPIRFGYFNFTSAEVTYKSDIEDTDFQVAWSSEPGEGGIIAFRDYNKRFSSHAFDWAAFAIMSLPSLAIPVFLWYSSKSKYEKLVKSSKRTH